MTQRVVNYTYGTGNQVLPSGSIDVRDGIDNLQSFDIFMNADEDAYNQRDGKVVRTLAGHERVVTNIINSAGYNFIGEFASGLVFSSVKDMTRYNGVLYVNSGSFPKLTSGNFDADGPWVALSSATGIFLYSFTATAGQTDFTIGAPVVPGTVPIVFRRGVYQQYGSAYNISTSDGKVFQFSEPLDAGDEIQIMAMSGADATGSANTAVSDHAALADPHSQYDYRWYTTTANTGELSGSKRVRWLADTSSARNRTIGSDVTDLLVKDATGQAGTNSVTIAAPAGKTINGAATEVIDVDYGWVQYTLVGTDFKTIGGQ